MEEADFVSSISMHLGHLYSLGEYISQLLPDTPEPETTTEGSRLRSELFGPLEEYLQRTDRYRKALFAYPDTDESDMTVEGCLANDLTEIYVYLSPIIQSDDHQLIESVAEHYVDSIVGQQALDGLRAIHGALYQDVVFDDDPRSR